MQQKVKGEVIEQANTNFTASALSFDPPDHEITDKPPHGANETLTTFLLFFHYMTMGVYVSATTVGAFGCCVLIYSIRPQTSHYQLATHMRCYSNPEDKRQQNPADPKTD